MVTCGNATVFITSMDAAIKFYTQTLGMNLKEHYGNHWATLEAGGFTIGLHPKSEKAPPPGTAGSICVGLVVADDREAVCLVVLVADHHGRAEMHFVARLTLQVHHDRPLELGIEITQVTLDDAATADELFSVLMGEDVEARRSFIQRNAKDVRFLDI